MIKFLVKCLQIYINAKKGDIQSRSEIAMLFYKSGNYKEAFKWLIELAEDNHNDSMSEVSFMYEKGLGVEQNIEESTKWKKKYAEMAYGKKPKKAKE